MTKTYENRTFDAVYDDEGTTFEDLRFVGCTFDRVVLSRSPVLDPAKRSTVRNVSLEKCTFQSGVNLGLSTFDEVTVEGLRIMDRGYEIGGSAFRHVTLKGRISPIRFMEFAATGYGPEGKANAETVNESNRAFHDRVDWALDIREARFAGVTTFENIPGRKILHDPETQVLVTPERAREVDYMEMDLGTLGIRVSIHMVRTGYDGVILAAPATGPHRDEFLRALDVLRAAGLVEAPVNS
jgi:hypothetical protein